MTVLNVGQLQGIFPTNEITVAQDTLLDIQGILRVATIQNSSGVTTLTTTPSGNVSIPKNIIVPATTTTNTISPSKLVIPTWTTSTRPSNPIVGTCGYNSTLQYSEVYNGSAWISLISTGSAATNTNVDQYWNNVVFLLKNGQNLDLSGRHTVTSTGSATTINTVPPFKVGGVSWSLGQNTSSGLNITGNLQDFALGANTTWTVEFWVHPINTSVYPHYFVVGGQNAQGTFKAWWDGSTFRPYMYTGNGLIIGSNVNSTITVPQQWIWLVYQRSGANMRSWINGTIYETSGSGGTIPTSNPGSVNLGYWSGESVPFYIDELRVTLGVARYGTSDNITIQNATWPTSS